MKIGLYFGSFNPIHIGHLIIANFVANETDIEQVWFVVSPQNPFKKSNTLLNEYQRLHLVNLAIEEDRQLRSSSIEFGLPKPSYTIDTLTVLEKKYPNNTFYIILGSDSFSNIQKWKNSELLLEKYHFFIYARWGSENKTLPRNAVLLNAPRLEISSTKIREYIKEGKSIKYWVPDVVQEEIEKNGYYKK